MKPGDERSNLATLNRIPAERREKLRRAIMRGQTNFQAAVETGCSVEEADAMRARLKHVGTLVDPPPPSPCCEAWEGRSQAARLRVVKVA